MYLARHLPDTCTPCLHMTTVAAQPEGLQPLQGNNDEEHVKVDSSRPTVWDEETAAEYADGN
jgi:hypothetical protein